METRGRGEAQAQSRKESETPETGRRDTPAAVCPRPQSRPRAGRVSDKRAGEWTTPGRQADDAAPRDGNPSARRSCTQYFTACLPAVTPINATPATGQGRRAEACAPWAPGSWGKATGATGTRAATRPAESQDTVLGGKATPRSLPRITLMVMKPEKWRAGRGEGASGAGGMEAGLVPKGRAGSLRYWSHPRLDCGGGHVTRTDEARHRAPHTRTPSTPRRAAATPMPVTLCVSISATRSRWGRLGKVYKGFFCIFLLRGQHDL